MADARFSQINLVSHNLSETLAFYRRLGVEIAPPWEAGGHPHHAEAQGGGDVSLEFDSERSVRTYNAGFAAERGRVVIGLALESREAVDLAWANMLADGAQGLQPPFDAFWGGRYAVIEDPDGNPVGLMSPIDPAKRGPLPNL